MSFKNPSSKGGGRSSSSRLISQLPDHIWTHISQFLTDEQVRRMYSVNRSLYRIAMAVRYREVAIQRLRGSGSEGTSKCLSIAENAELRGHVRSLLFTSTPLEANSHSPSDNAFGEETAVNPLADQFAIVKLAVSRWRAKVQPPPTPIAPQFQPSPISPSNAPLFLTRTFSLGRRRTREQAARDDLIADVGQFLGRLPKLTDLTVNYATPNEGADIEDTWSLCLLSPFGSATPYSTCLRSLTVTGSITNWKRVIPPHHEWPHLENFHVRVDTGYRNPQDDIYAIRLELTTFIRRHSSTLKGVSFASTMALDLTSLYDGMGSLPRLEHFRVEQPYLPPTHNHSDALNQFLFRHRDILKSFEWIFVNPRDFKPQSFTLHPDDWFEQPPYHHTLPVLRNLHLSFPNTPSVGLFEGILFYYVRHASTITHLTLTGLTLTLPQFHEFLLLFGAKQLQELHISLDVLTSAVLKNLSKKFPILRLLHLGYTSVGRQKSLSEAMLVDPTAGGILKIPNVPVVKTWQFRQDMATLSLSQWPVIELYLRRNVDRSWREYKGDQVGKVVVKSLPRVAFVNGVYREVFLQ